MADIWIETPYDQYSGVKVHGGGRDGNVMTFRGPDGRVDKDFLKAYIHAVQMDDDPVVIDPSCKQFCQVVKKYKWDSSEERIVLRHGK